MRETYSLNGPKDFYFPHPVRYPAQITVEVIPGGILPSSQYQVIGYGPTATGVTVRYPSAPTDGTQELAISRQTEPERVSEFEDDVGATAAALNAEFDNLYQVLQDLNLEDWRGDWAAFTTYEINSVIYGPDGNIYRATQPHTSGSSFEADLDAGLWSLIVNFAFAQQQVDASVDLAERWASEDEDVEVQGGEFSSKHYAAKSSSSATAAASSALSAANSADEATAALEDFQGRYYGPLSEDPTEDPNGNAPTAGDFYFNTVGTVWRIFNGSAWQTASALVDLGTAATLDASSTATPNHVVLLDGYGRAQVATPSAAADIATKGYADNAGIPSGTSMLFNQASAPTGWTKKTDWANTASVIVGNTYDSGGDHNPVSFSTGISVGDHDAHGHYVAGHQHAYTTVIAHSHGLVATFEAASLPVPTGNMLAYAAQSIYKNSPTSSQYVTMHTGSIQSTGDSTGYTGWSDQNTSTSNLSSHSVTQSTYTPRYVTVIAATKN